MRPRNRGYYVSRQAYAGGDPVGFAVEVAYSNDRNPPREHASADEMVAHFGCDEGQTFDWPVPAVEAAIRIRALWLEWLARYDPDAGGDCIQLTVATGGGMIAPEVMSEDELRAWADSRYTRKETEPQVPAKPTPEQQATIDRFKAAEREGLVRIECETDEMHEIDFSGWDVSDEEREDLEALEIEEIEAYGVWGIKAQIASDDGFEWEDVGPGWVGGHVGQIDWCVLLPFMEEALSELDDRADRLATALAQELEGRATYAGPVD
jgi:hypothetical protein